MPMQSRSTSSKRLADFFEVNHRYTRSVNLERDLGSAACLNDYIVTERAAHTFGRIASAMSQRASRSWVLTGVYGTGKSAFAHFLTSVFSPKKTELKATARKILSRAVAQGQLLEDDLSCINDEVLFAVATAEREPIGHTLLRAIQNVLVGYKGKEKRKKETLLKEISRLGRSFTEVEQTKSSEIIQVIRDVSELGGSGLFIVIDEMGRSLEHAAQNRHPGDLYILQQLCELPQDRKSPIFFLGLLHHSFSEYGIELGAADRSEWLKIQGRFEEIPFTESAAQMVQLMAEVLRNRPESKDVWNLDSQAARWSRRLPDQLRFVSSPVLSKLLPLHPVTALVLPQLFTRYAQNDRSLFSFLTSYEPNSFRSFLEQTHTDQDHLPLFKIAGLYDYFTETSLSNLVLKPNFQRWTEVKHLIDEHENDDRETVFLLKTIGIFNLISSLGTIRATRDLVTLSLCDSPTDKADISKWNKAIDKLIAKGLIVHRRQIDELRLWEGSDFDFDDALARSREKAQATLAGLLEDSYPARTIVAQRHSYESGAVRYFESRYFDDPRQFSDLECQFSGSTGLIGFWVSDTEPDSVPATVKDGRPFVLIPASQVSALRSAANEYAALNDVLQNSSELASDGVARREVRHRLNHSRHLLDESFAKAFDRSLQAKAWVTGKSIEFGPKQRLNGELSKLCDKLFKHRLVLWNELINRQELTSQGAKARRQVIAAMLEAAEKELLGLSGNGPEVSVYRSVLSRTGIHQLAGEAYMFGRPTDTRFGHVWDEIEKYCLDSIEKARGLDGLFETLQKPPYGLKSGLIPILFAAVIISHSDDIGIYRDDAFIPQLGPEHFELLVKDPSRFSVKHFKIAGVRADVFRGVETILMKGVGLPAGIRNRSILSVVTPLLKFARKLPRYSQTTQKLSPNALEVRTVLLQAPEPDEMLFELLPRACGFPPFTVNGKIDIDLPKKFTTELTLGLKEIREAYEVLLSQCRTYLYEAFGVKQEIRRLREDLRTRASYLQDRSIEPILTRFIFAAADPSNSDEDWLEALLMVIADKPVESWTDSDADVFEFTLADIARRFTHLEAIYKNNTSLWAGSAEARRISIIRTDGTDVHDIAWIDETQKPLIEKMANDLLDQMGYDKTQQKAVLATLAEKILDLNTNRNLVEIKAKLEEKDAPRFRPLRRQG